MNYMKKECEIGREIDGICYKLIRSKRRTISMGIGDDCDIIVRAPLKMPQQAIEEFIKSHKYWLEKHMPSAKSRMELEAALNEQAIDELIRKAKQYIPPRVEHYAKIMGVEPTGIKITAARKRFGSCSGRNSLCFSYRLMQYPIEAIDSVIVHELAHIKHHDHSAAFYSFILRFMPDYYEREKLLKG